MTTKLLSSCCSAPAKVNMVARAIEGQTRYYWCTKCGEPCDTRQERSGFGAKRSTLSTIRKPSGERPLFIELWAKCAGKSEVSGTPLLPPEHPQFHYQGSHLLPKGTYPDYQLKPENIVMMTPEEHRRWHDEGPERLKADPQWRKVVERYEVLHFQANAKHRA